MCPDVQVLLMTDILVFLQEKDQRFFFSCLVSMLASVWSTSFRETLKINVGLTLSPPHPVTLVSPMVQDKPAVLSLQNLIVRDIANQERGMFLIIDSAPPVMYEFHATSKDNKNMWMRQIQHAVSR